MNNYEVTDTAGIKYLVQERSEEAARAFMARQNITVAKIVLVFTTALTA